MPPADLRERLDRYIAEFIRHNLDMEFTSQEAMVQLLFLSLADPNDVSDYNARRTYVELIGIPSVADIKEYCLMETAHQWVSSPNGLFKQKLGEGEVVSDRTYTARVLRADFRRRVEALKRKVEIFESIGMPLLYHIARDRTVPKEQRITRILFIRETFEVPTKDHFLLDDEGRIARIAYIPFDEHIDQAVVTAIRGD